MTRSKAKAYALLIVNRWYELNRPTSGRINGYRIAGQRVIFDYMSGRIYPATEAWERAFTELRQ